MLMKRWKTRCRGRYVMIPDGAGVDEDDPLFAEPLARGRDLRGVLRHATQPVRTPAELGRDVPLVADASRLGQRLSRRISEQDGRIGQAWLGALIPQELVDRRLEAATEQIPHRDVNPGEGVGCLQEIEAVGADEIADAVDIGNVVEGLPKDGVAHRFAGAVRHGADEAGDGDQRRGLTLAPPDVRSRLQPDQQQILAAVADVEHLRHRQVVEIDRPRSAFRVNLLLRVVPWARTVSG